jgi:hypothetical protein
MSGGSVATSTDGAKSWAIVSPKLDLQNLVVDPQDSAILYAVSLFEGHAGSFGIVKSTDGGASWSVMLSEATNQALTWVAVAPTAGGTSAVYAGGDWRGILKSSDGGVTWATANSGLIATEIDSLAIDPQNARTLYVGVHSAGIFKSVDGAVSWSATPALGVFYSVAVDPRNEGTLYAWDGGGTRKSVDGGQTWGQILAEGDAAAALS